MGPKEHARRYSAGISRFHLFLTSGLDMADKLPANARFIRKPYSAEQVAAELHELFGQSTSPGGLLSGGGKNCGKLA
jgi:hypothetical protein